MRVGGGWLRADSTPRGPGGIRLRGGEAGVGGGVGVGSLPPPFPDRAGADRRPICGPGVCVAKAHALLVRPTPACARPVGAGLRTPGRCRPGTSAA